MTNEKEIKEITKQTDRWVRIKKKDVEITISTPFKEDDMDKIVDKADALASKHGAEIKKTNYIQ